MNEVKKKYKIGDSAWIYGVTSGPGYNRLVHGKVIHELKLKDFSETQYIIAIDNEIEPLLEIRDWGSISQDAKGPVGLFRECRLKFSPAKKLLARRGLILPLEEPDEDQEPDDNNAEES